MVGLTDKALDKAHQPGLPRGTKQDWTDEHGHQIETLMEVLNRLLRINKQYSASKRQLRYTQHSGTRTVEERVLQANI